MTSVITVGRARGLRGPGPFPASRVPRRQPAASGPRSSSSSVPPSFLFLGFVILPVILAAVYSFYNLPPAFQWSDLNPERFIGFQNYVRALTDPEFTRAIGNNFFILAMSLLIQGPIAIGVALLLNRSLRGRGAFRLLIFVPYVLAEVIAGLAWKLLLQPQRRRQRDARGRRPRRPAAATGSPIPPSRCGRSSSS